MSWTPWTNIWYPTGADLLSAVNAISDVIENRPLPIREFDQIYMKAGDLVAQACFVAHRFRDKDVVFIGDGDGIALSVLHLVKLSLIPEGPRSVTVLDFDERICGSIERFADRYKFQDKIKVRPYNVVEPIPDDLLCAADAFYTNPPWGRYNDGESVNIFIERGIACMRRFAGEGCVVIADDPSLTWTQDNLLASQQCAAHYGFNVAEMVPAWHVYHLDDAPNLRSCSMVLRRVTSAEFPLPDVTIDEERLRNFYGRNQPLEIFRVSETKTLNHGRAPQESYGLVPYKEKGKNGP